MRFVFEWISSTSSPLRTRDLPVARSRSVIAGPSIWCEYACGFAASHAEIFERNSFRSMAGLLGPILPRQAPDQEGVLLDGFRDG